MAELKRISSLSDEYGGHVNTTFYQAHPELANENSDEKGGVPKAKMTVSETGKDIKRTRWKLLKNVVIVSFGFLLLFTAFQSLSNLQSSVNSDSGLGTTSLSVIYASLVVSCMFVPTYMIRLLGLKYTLIVSMLLYSGYFAANFKATWYSLMPTSLLLGLGGAPLWTAKCAYLTESATRYAALTDTSSEVWVVRFFGFFFMVFQSGQIWGNLISYYVLSPGGVAPNQTKGEFCGSEFCPSSHVITNNTNLERPSDSKVTLLCAVYTGCALMASVFIFLFLDPLERRSNEEKGQRAPWKLLLESFRHMRHKYQMLIIPLTIFSGLEQAFIIGDFTQAFVSCSWGIHNVGYVMICFGLADALGSAIFGHLIRKVGRVTIFVAGAAVNVGMIILMYTWTPDPETPFIFFLISGLWGLGDAVWQTQINSLYGVIFPNAEEPAFANYRLWESLGFIVAFAYSSSLCINVKLALLLGVLVIGMAGYITIEMSLWRKAKDKPVLPTDQK